MDKTSIDRMTLFRSFVDFADGLPNDDMRGRFYTGLARYALDGIEPEFDDSLCRSGFLLIKPVIDKSNHNRRPGNSNAKKRELNANQSRLKRDLNATSSKDIGIGEGIGNNIRENPESDFALAASFGAESVFPFNAFWEAYGKKIDRKKCQTKYSRISEPDRAAIKAKLPAYLAATPEVQYRKAPLRWLTGECWNDDPILSQAHQNSAPQPGSREAAILNMLK